MELRSIGYSSVACNLLSRPFLIFIFVILTNFFKGLSGRDGVDCLCFDEFGKVCKLFSIDLVSKTGVSSAMTASSVGGLEQQDTIMTP